LGLLQREVAGKLGVTDSTIWNWETNHNSPQLRFIPRIITFLGYDPHCMQSDSLGKRLVAYRRPLGLSQKELARRLGTDPTTLGRWKRGKGEPSRKLMPKVIAVLTGKCPDTSSHYKRGRKKAPIAVRSEWI
jgi:transcriptional regulator with XRE-family HTH domain